MTCVECQEFGQRMLDRRSGEVDAAAADHIASCPDCAQWHAAARRLVDGLHLLSRPQPPKDFAVRVAARIVADQRARRQLRRRMSLTAALAASLLVAIFAGYHWLGPKETASPPISVAGRENPVPETQGPAPSTRESVTEAGEAVASLSKRASQETMEQTRLLWPVAAAPLSFEGIDLQTPLEPPAQSLREAGQNVSSGLEPVTNSARRAVNLFWRELPPVEPGKKQRS